MLIIGAIVLLLALVLYAGTVATVSDLHCSDPAGNALASAFGTMMAIALWILLAVLLLIAGSRGDMPEWTIACAFILVPASFAALIGSIKLLERRARDSSKWPVMVPAIAPPLMIAFAIWAAFPSLHAKIPPLAAGLVAWTPILLLCFTPWRALAKVARENEIAQAAYHAQYVREEAAKREQERVERLAKFEKLPPDAPLWEWRWFTEHEPELRERALAGIKKLARRQADAEEILEKGVNFPMLELPNLDLQPTPALCDSARKFLTRQADYLRPRSNPTPPFSAVAPRITCYLPAIAWLLNNGCDCKPEIAEIESATKLYANSPERAEFLAALTKIVETADGHR